MNKGHGTINYDGYMMTDYNLLEGNVVEIRQFDIEDGTDSKVSDKVFITVDDLIKFVDELKVKTGKGEAKQYEFGSHAVDDSWPFENEPEPKTYVYVGDPLKDDITFTGE